ncbi:MAG: DUF302 domain-containing protein [Burkholderiales bacterium]|nr:DUF302 domain-containing protein [Burkholderiales bacterium]
MSKYAFGKTVDLTFDQACARVTEALGKEGFGVLTEIDVAATLKNKLDKDVPPYKILGACNPHFAHQALAAEPEIGTLLPCNVVVRVDAGGGTRVDFMDPHAVLELVRRKEIDAVAAQVRERLQRVMNAL